MAIRFVDVKPEEAEGAEPAGRRARSPETLPEKAPAPEEAEFEPDAPEPTGAGAIPGDGEPPALPHAKPEPKPRGRKKPMSAVGADKRAAGQGAPDEPGAASAPLLEGLLPELQAHAKPTPKPRGRRKAFG